MSDDFLDSEFSRGARFLGMASCIEAFFCGDFEASIISLSSLERVVRVLRPLREDFSLLFGLSNFLASSESSLDSDMSDDFMCSDCVRDCRSLGLARCTEQFFLVHF